MDGTSESEHEDMVAFLQFGLSRNKHTVPATYHAGKRDVTREFELIYRSAYDFGPFVHLQLGDLCICQSETPGRISVGIEQYLEYLARRYEFFIDYGAYIEVFGLRDKLYVLYLGYCFLHT